MRQVKDVAKRLFLLLHRALLRVGVVLLPNHYYSSVPDINELGRTRQRWARPSEMPGVDFDIRGQLKFLRDACKDYQHEYLGAENYHYAVANHFGPGYGLVEAQLLHAFIRRYKPSRVIEIGSGVSTYCMLKAAELNRAEGHETQICCVEPHPSAFIRGASIELQALPVQELEK